MIIVSGVIGIYSEPEFVQIKSGYYAKFESATLVKKNEQKRAYRWTSIYIPEKEIEKAKEKLIPGRLLQLEKAQWIAPDQPKHQREKTQGNFLSANWYDVVLLPYEENRD